MIRPAKVYTESWDVNSRLAELGLEATLLLRAVERGFAGWASCTPNHPRCIPGIWAWGETFCALSEELIPLGWRRVDEANWPLVINKNATIALSVATGNEDTGRDGDRDPLTISTKGPRTANAVAVNRRQLLLTEILPSIESLNTPGRQTWLVLIHRDTDVGEMRCELSRPISLDPRRRVNEWTERIVLKPRPFDGMTNILAGGGNEPQTPEIKVEIRRRT